MTLAVKSTIFEPKLCKSWSSREYALEDDVLVFTSLKVSDADHC